MNQTLGSHDYSKTAIPKLLCVAVPSQITPMAHSAPHN